MSGLVELFYKLLGLVAATSYRLSRTRVNAIPSNWIIMVFLGMLCAFAGWEVRESLVNRGEAEDVSISQVIQRGDIEDHFVRTHGQFIPDAALAWTTKDKPDDPERIFIPIVDLKTKSAVYVQVDKGTGKKSGDLDATHVTGMVRKLDHDLKEHLGKSTAKFAEFPIDTFRMIVAAQRPARAEIWIPVTVAGAALLLLMLIAIAKGHVIFRPTGDWGESASPETTPAENQKTVRVTGKFSLGPKDRQRFHNIPAMIAELEGGMKGFVTQADASNRFMGAVTRQRKGVWLIPIRSGSMSEAEAGRYYFAGAGWPAFRVRYVDDMSGKIECAIVAGESLEAVDTAREALFENAR